MRKGAPRLDLRSLCALWLAALQGCAPADAAPNTSPLQSTNWGNPRRFIHLQTSTDLSTFYLEISLNGHVRKSARRGSYSVIQLRAEARDRVAIFGVKSSRFLCMDAEGTLFTSTVCSRDDCLFLHTLLENHRDVYYSPRTGLLLNLDGAKQRYAAGQNLPRSALFLSEKNTVSLERLKLRDRRNRQADLSDPLRALGYEEESDSRAVQEDDGEQDQELSEDRNTSREAPLSPSDDDPWSVAQARNPGSPRLSAAGG